MVEIDPKPVDIAISKIVEIKHQRGNCCVTAVSGRPMQPRFARIDRQFQPSGHLGRCHKIDFPGNIAMAVHARHPAGNRFIAMAAGKRQTCVDAAAARVVGGSRRHVVFVDEQERGLHLLAETQIDIGVQDSFSGANHQPALPLVNTRGTTIEQSGFDIHITVERVGIIPDPSDRPFPAPWNKDALPEIHIDLVGWQRWIDHAVNPDPDGRIEIAFQCRAQTFRDPLLQPSLRCGVTDPSGTRHENEVLECDLDNLAAIGGADRQLIGDGEEDLVNRPREAPNRPERPLGLGCPPTIHGRPRRRLRPFLPSQANRPDLGMVKTLRRQNAWLSRKSTFAGIMITGRSDSSLNRTGLPKVITSPEHYQDRSRINIRAFFWPLGPLHPGRSQSMTSSSPR
jgi:hypothetical protein